jgi:ferrochelatase
MRSSGRQAVVLFQLGGPDSLRAVEPFLYNLFCDPDIIDLPGAFLFRRGLARLISRLRAPKVAEHYRRIGGRSPILKLTQRQASALSSRLRGRFAGDVHVAMRYWHPMTGDVVDRVVRERIDRVVLLPLYPQYSNATTGSSLREWNRVLRRRGIREMAVDVIEEYCEHPSYVGAIVRNIRIALNRVPVADRGKVHLVFSAHGTPVRLVERGDPYQGQVLRTYQAVTRAGAFALPHCLCYQSKVGPQRWLEPSLRDTIASLAAAGVTHVLVIPIGFVSDHIETLYEINMEVREEAGRQGIRHYDMMPALHTAPQFIEALADSVLRKLGS